MLYIYIKSIKDETFILFVSSMFEYISVISYISDVCYNITDT